MMTLICQRREDAGDTDLLREYSPHCSSKVVPLKNLPREILPNFTIQFILLSLGALSPVGSIVLQPLLCQPIEEAR